MKQLKMYVICQYFCRKQLQHTLQHSIHLWKLLSIVCVSQMETRLLEKRHWQVVVNRSKVCWFGYAWNRVGCENYDFIFDGCSFCVKTFYVYKLIFSFTRIFWFLKAAQKMKIWSLLIWVLRKTHGLSVELLTDLVTSGCVWQISYSYQTFLGRLILRS